MHNVISSTGNQAAAFAMRQIEPDICAAYPITPSTQIMETFTGYVAEGKARTGLILVESEHSAMSACVGASATGARVMTATSSQGLALMHEVLYIASGMRLPIVMAVATRALSAPINIHGDHSDVMGSRDAGWIQLHVQNVQEAYDTVIQAVRIAEHPDVLLPVMVCFDGFTISHCLERLEVIDDAGVRNFVGEYIPSRYLLDTENPQALGVFALPSHYMGMKLSQREAMGRALEVLTDIDGAFHDSFGRSYGAIESYRLDDAEMGIVVIGSTAGTVKDAADMLRNQGMKVGVLRVRAFRPFPERNIREALGGLRAIAVLDRADAPGSSRGPLFCDVRSALYDAPKKPFVTGSIYGLGGRELSVEEAETIYRQMSLALENHAAAEMPEYLDARQKGEA